MFAAEERGELPSGTARRWAEHTRDISRLPERVKKSVSLEWVRKRVLSGVRKGQLSKKRFHKLQKNLDDQYDRLYDKAYTDPKAARLQDKGTEFREIVTKYNPYDYPHGKGLPERVKSSADKKKEAVSKEWISKMIRGGRKRSLPEAMQDIKRVGKMQKGFSDFDRHAKQIKKRLHLQKELATHLKESADKKAPSRWEGAVRGSGSGLATAGLLAGTAAGTLMAAKDLKRGNLVGAGKRIVGIGGAGWMTGALAGTAKGAISPKSAASLDWADKKILAAAKKVMQRTGKKPTALRLAEERAAQSPQLKDLVKRMSPHKTINPGNRRALRAQIKEIRDLAKSSADVAAEAGARHALRILVG